MIFKLGNIFCFNLSKHSQKVGPIVEIKNVNKTNCVFYFFKALVRHRYHKLLSLKIIKITSMNLVYIKKINILNIMGIDVSDTLKFVLYQSKVIVFRLSGATSDNGLVSINSI